MGLSQVVIPHLQHSNVIEQVMVLVGALNKGVFRILI